MNKQEPRLEYLINRRLDGLLTAEESYELDKRLIRDPQARRELEALQQVDQLTADVLDAVCVSGLPEDALNSIVSRRRRRRYGWMLAPISAAACVGWALLWMQPVHPVGTLEGDPQIAVSPADFEPRDVTAWSDLPPVGARGTVVDYYGVLDEDQEALYLLEVKRTTEHHGSGSGAQPMGKILLASGEM